MITASMTPGEVILKYPACADVFEDFGMHCVGCKSSMSEKISDAILKYNLDDEDLRELIAELNQVADESILGKLENQQS